MPYIIGTAGHIDHGKTSLIKALTGQDTDRLKEEKERGISIDLGFAHFDLPDGTRAGVVDVPGHERFIRNMLAGAHGIDLVLFTVAADDGVMPQTEEHLDILHLLGVRRAVFVITKTDIASPERIREVEEEISILTAGTSVEGAPVVPFSFVTGEGLPELRTEIIRTIEASQKTSSPGYFRLPIDRVFALAGHGLVVTGTALSGEVRVGDRVRCLPGGHLLRVRSVQIHNDPVEVATGGQRVALNLSGHEKVSIERGHVICDEAITTTTERFDAFVEIRPTSSAVKNHQRVRVHLGTAERLGKLIILGSADRIEPKHSAFCQIVLGDPLLALRRDHFIIRDETAQHTLGGGVVLHPWATRHKRSDRDLPRRLETLREGTPDALIRTFVDESEELAVSAVPIAQFMNLPDVEVRQLLDRMAAVDSDPSVIIDVVRPSPGSLRLFDLEGEKLYTTELRWRRVEQQVATALEEFHRAHPLLAGMDMEALRARLPYQIGSRLFRALVEQLASAGTVTRDANLIRLPAHHVRLAGEDEGMAVRIRAELGRTPLAPPDLKQIEKDLGIGRARLMEIIRLMERDGTVVRVSSELFFLRDQIDQLKNALLVYLREKHEISAGVFRDAFGTSRKYAIPLLEYFDREGTTVRIGDVRRLKRDRG